MAQSGRRVPLIAICYKSYPANLMGESCWLLPERQCGGGHVGALLSFATNACDAMSGLLCSKTDQIGLREGLDSSPSREHNLCPVS